MIEWGWWRVGHTPTSFESSLNMHVPSGTVGSPGGSGRLDLCFWVAMVGVLHAGTSESAWDRAVHVQSVYTCASPF